MYKDLSYTGYTPTTTGTTLGVFTEDREIIFYKPVLEYQVCGFVSIYPENKKCYVGTITFIDPCTTGIEVIAPV